MPQTPSGSGENREFDGSRRPAEPGGTDETTLSDSPEPAEEPELSGRPSSPNVAPSTAAVAALFLKLGLTAFGGPAAHIAMMQEEVVERRKWLTRDEFLDLLGAANLIPGPSSTELAIFIGYRVAGATGLLLAGVCFIVPAFLLVLALSAAYVRYGRLPQVGGALYGVKPVVIAIIAQALWNLGRTAIKTRWLGVLGLILLVPAFLGISPILLLLTCGLVVGVTRWIKTVNVDSRESEVERTSADPAQDNQGTAGPAERRELVLEARGPEPRLSPKDLSERLDRRRPLRRKSFAASLSGLAPVLALSSILALVAVAPIVLRAGPAASAGFGISALFWVFVRIGSVIYGSGYLLLAFLRSELIERRGWLTSAQLLDAVAVGQVTPGPVFTTATFIGFVLGGPQGAIAATVGIFLPAFLFVGLFGRFVSRLRAAPITGAFLDGVNVAALALMASVTWQLARGSLIDPLTASIAAVSFALLIRFRVNPTWLIAAGVVTGLLAWLVRRG